MKKIFYLLLCIVLVVSNMSCNDDDEKVLTVTPEATGTVTDRDGNEYKWVRYNGIDWMASNFRGGAPYYEATDSWGDDVISFDDKDQAIADCEIYGNLYTWEEAQDPLNIPEGWRLPTDEDWQNLETTLGMSAVTAASKGWRGKGVTTLLRQEEGTGLGLQLAGNASLSGVPERLYLNFLKEFGYYWTATEEENNGLQETTVFYRKIFGSRTTVYRDAAPLNILMRIRCVRDAQKD